MATLQFLRKSESPDICHSISHLFAYYLTPRGMRIPWAKMFWFVLCLNNAFQWVRHSLNSLKMWIPGFNLRESGTWYKFFKLKWQSPSATESYTTQGRVGDGGIWVKMWVHVQSTVKARRGDEMEQSWAGQAGQGGDLRSLRNPMPC